ncbi:MAG: DUF72 domain-containing protein [Thiohalocapsa sp.]|nr:DUF72 domain-containing protein [Thiohalocapsa sp.]
MKQLSLIDDDRPDDRPDDERARSATVEPAPVAPELAALAAALPLGLRLGTSSWSFPGWAGLVYAAGAPKQSLSREGLRAYSAHPLLRTVGVDSGFYAPLDRRRLAGYASQVPEDFRFLVKAPALVTDRFRRDGRGRGPSENPAFMDPETAIAAAAAPFVEGLGDGAGVLLFQFPPLGRAITDAPRRFAEDLYRFLRRLPKGPVYAVELRDPELLTPDLAAALRHGGALPGLAAHPRLPFVARQRDLFAGSADGAAPQGPLVVRWLLRRNRGYAEARDRYAPFDRLSEPDSETRAAIAEMVGEALAGGREVFVIVNNKAEGSSPLTLAELARALTKGRRGAAAGPRS